MQAAKINQLIGIAYVNLATLVWASNMVLGRMLKDDIGPISLSTLRFLLASVIYFALLQRLPVKDRKPGTDWKLLLLMALTGVVYFSPVLYLGLHYTTAVNSTIINGMAPLFTGIFAVWLLKEPMSGRQMTGAALAFTGVLVLISGGSLAFWQKAGFNIGDIIVLSAVVVWGLYSVVSSRVMKNRSSLSATALSTMMGTVVLCPLMIWEWQHTPLQLNANLLLLIFYLGVMPAAVGFYAWNAGVARLGASGAMIYLNTLPLYGAFLGFLFLGEPIGLPHVAGGLLIAAGGIWAARKKAPDKAEVVPETT